MKRLADIKPVGHRWHETPSEQRQKAMKAALESGLLRVGDYYSLRLAQRLIDQFYLLGPDYEPIWFEPVANVPVGVVRFLPDENRPSTRTMIAWRLYNKRLYRTVWKRSPWGVEPEKPQTTAQP